MKKVVILCGGQGLRIKGNFDVPKPLVKINEKCLLEYIIDCYTTFGLKEFFLLVGENEIEFQEFAKLYSNSEFKIEVIQTGSTTPTGGRLKKAENWLNREESFLMTYGDGISNVNMDELIKFHQMHKKTVTITAVKPQLPFGFLVLNAKDEVISFAEKPISENYINGGFFVLNKNIFNYLTEQSDFETETLVELSRKNELCAFKHHGFWKSMDTYKDYISLMNTDVKLNSDRIK